MPITSLTCATVVARIGFAGDAFRISNYRDNAKERVGHVVRAVARKRRLVAKPENSGGNNETWTPR
jgi:hypothetical protein